MTAHGHRTVRGRADPHRRPEFQRLYVRCDHAFGWERLERLADEVVACRRRWESGHGESTWAVDDPITAALATSPSGFSPGAAQSAL